MQRILNIRVLNLSLISSSYHMIKDKQFIKLKKNWKIYIKIFLSHIFQRYPFFSHFYKIYKYNFFSYEE